MSSENTSLESSIRILLSLCAMVGQDLEALVYYGKYVDEESLDRTKINLPPKDETLDYAVLDSIWFQIIIRSCAFLDEWDKFLGVLNEPEYSDRLMLIKKVVAPAKKAINKWKELRKFRNEITAHNFRGKEKIVTIDQMGQYDCPQSETELYYLVSFIDRMTRVLVAAFPKEYELALESSKKMVKKKQKDISENRLKELKQSLIEVDDQISNRVFDIYRYDFLQNLSTALSDKSRKE